MPRSRSRAVCTSPSERPSSTSVIAISGRMPTTTVSASNNREIEAIVANIRPMNESTISTAVMSMTTPVAPVVLILSARSSWSAMALWSCRSIWIDTSRTSPMLRIGTRSVTTLPTGVVVSHSRGQRARSPDHLDAVPEQRVPQRVREGRLRHDVAELDAERDDGLGDLRADAGDDALRAHQSRRHHGLEQVLGDLRVPRAHAGDVADGVL